MKGDRMDLEVRGSKQGGLYVFCDECRCVHYVNEHVDDMIRTTMRGDMMRARRERIQTVKPRLSVFDELTQEPVKRWPNGAIKIPMVEMKELAGSVLAGMTVQWEQEYRDRIMVLTKSMVSLGVVSQNMARAMVGLVPVVTPFRDKIARKEPVQGSRIKGGHYDLVIVDEAIDLGGKDE